MSHGVRRIGFTIMELLVVMLVMGIIAATTAPSFYVSLRYHELESAARRVKLDLEQARHVARVKSQTQSLTFTGPTTYQLSPGIASLSSGNTYAVDLSRTPYDLETVTIDLGDPDEKTVRFDGYGNAVVGGTIALAIGDKSRTIHIDASNSQITISNP
jgi:type II secretion system protein H